MASNKTIDIEMFFKVVSSGSVNELEQLTINHAEPEDKSKIANSINSKGETPLIVAIKRNHYYMVDYLVKVLEASIYQLGRFIWKGSDLPNVPPLFVAILCGMDNHIIEFLINRDLAYNRPTGWVDAIIFNSLTPAMGENVLKLIGAAYILQGWRIGKRRLFEFGLHLWSKAIWRFYKPCNPVIKRRKGSQSFWKCF